MNILEYIPKGRKNAISRRQLAIRTGITDRKLRRYIQEAKLTNVIASTDDGSGYFIPEENDYNEVLAYRRREKAKALSIIQTLKMVDAWLDDVENNRFCGGW